MRVAVFSAQRFDRQFLDEANHHQRHDLVFLEARLELQTSVLARGCAAVCVFVNDRLDRDVLEALSASGIQFVALRSAGFNHVDLDAARSLRMRVARVPAYSPHAVAEHAVALILALNRKIPRAHSRVREGNFSLEGLLGFDLHGSTVGVIGTGQIGTVVARILLGLGCRLLAYDPAPNADCAAMGVSYVDLDTLFATARILTLHAPLTPDTRHVIDATAISRMQPGVMIINTSRGGLVDTRAIINGLKSGRIGYLGLDVYEEEEGLFFRDLSLTVLQDDVFARLLTFPNVLITGHQAFFTREALHGIAETTVANLDAFERGVPSASELT